MLTATLNKFEGTQGTQMVNWVNRNFPVGKDEKSKFTTEDDFELVYLRHRYIQKSPNPSTARMNLFQRTAKSVAKKAAAQFEYVFMVNGQDIDDLTNVALMHVVSYLGQFGLREHPEKLKSFSDTFKKRKEKEFKKVGIDLAEVPLEALLPTDKDIDKKDKSNCKAFIWQRLEEWGKVASIKNKNIRGTYSHSGYYKCIETLDDELLEDRTLLESGEKMGFIAITKKEFEETKKKAKVHKKDTKFSYNGFKFRKAYVSPSELTKDDVSVTMYGAGRSAFYSTPLENLILVQNPIGESYRTKMVEELNTKGREYNDRTSDSFLVADYLSEPKKIQMLKKYVEKNLNNEMLMSDVEEAIEFIQNYEPDYRKDFNSYGQGAYSMWPRR